jgi:glycosyltransferase involved in cell wall biosynthesis
VAALGPFLARRFGCPWLLEVRDIWPESAASVGWLRSDGMAYRMLARFARSVTRRSPTVIVPTPGLEPLVRAHGAKEVCVLPGIVSARDSDPERRRRIRSELGFGEDRCVFLYLGAIGVANGLDLLLDAVASLPAEVPAHVVVAGDGSARRSFAEAVDARRLNRITLLPPVDQEGVADLLAAADVGLHLLRPDPVFGSALPTKALEYLGAGLPFVTTVPGLPSEVAVASGGAAVSSAAELTGELVAWSESGAEELRERGRQALRYGLENFGLDANVSRLEGLLDRTRREHPRR